MGRVLATFRCWPGPIASAVMVAITVGVVTWQWLAVPDDPLWFRFFVLLLMVLLCSAIALPGVLERHRVCERGLVLGYGPTRSARYVVPWGSVDPARVRVLRRSQLISRHRGMPQVSPHYRIGTGPLAYRSLAVNGLDSATDAGTWVHIPGLLETTTTMSSGSGRRKIPYAWWILGTPHPQKLARVIEEAMVAAGHTAARGMAARAVEQEIVVPWTPGPTPLRPRTK
ncbi:hypothetical protein [Ornithinimicrobium sufpigmenti]|uniref:hypothetical protein n=1 Tax=Ornithinimicrobium sufpigmenti TaxID=2508882 RepID=UPI0010360C6E|nr:MULTISPECIES: hypothetical protein [unclassified Ornithinimicrobium]